MTTKQWSGLLLALVVLRVARGVAIAATPQYVAMGSSYAAGPGILPMVPGSPLRCARSAEDYAHVLARLRALSLVDVTCSGATTVDVLQAGQFSLPAQLDAVTAQTHLVTVTIGGNDVFFMANLMGMSCDRSVVAKETESGLLDVALLSHGHDACSKNPWVLGAHREQGSLIPPFHPTREAMQAVGGALNACPELLH